MNCRICDKKCCKNGFQSNSVQRYICRYCKKSQQKKYIYKAYKANTNKQVYTLLVNSCGINDISRILKISRHTVLKRMLQISSQIQIPIFNEYDQSYEADEMFVKVKGMGNNCWVSYVINRKTKTVINYTVGKRRSIDIAPVINSVLLLNPKRIYTDRWVAYKKTIPEKIHSIGHFHTNAIERFHLNLRTHLKCLSRKTICYSKSLVTLNAIVRLYFWGHMLNFKT